MTETHHPSFKSGSYFGTNPKRVPLRALGSLWLNFLVAGIGKSPDCAKEFDGRAVLVVVR
jgi:hypothetical protein